MGLLRAIVTVGGFTMLSRILGFVRDILIAATLGAGPIADAFFVAFKFPNLFRRLFAEGAFASAFVPILAGHVEAKDERAAQVFAERALSGLFLIVSVVVVIAELTMPFLMMAFAPGFTEDPAKFNLTVILTQITFPYLLFVSMASLFSGVLNTHGRFAAAAATPILLNICLIGAVILLAPLTPSVGHALAIGVFIAGLVQVVFLYGACVRAGIILRPRKPELADDIRLLFKRTIPVAIGAGVYQINLMIDTIIASLLATGSIAYLFYADRVVQLPLGVVGVAVGTALLPSLSRAIKAGDATAARNGQNRAIEFALLLTLPAAVALAMIAGPIVSTLFERGAFDAEASMKTAAALGVYAFGLPAYVMIKALAPGFFARGDTKTPVIIAVVAMAVNLGLNLMLMGPYQHVGIAMATVASSWLNVCLMASYLRKRGALDIDDRLKARFWRIAAACALMAVVLWTAHDQLASALTSLDMTVRVLAFVGLVAAGLFSYTAAAFLFRAVRANDLSALRRRTVPLDAP